MIPIVFHFKLNETYNNYNYNVNNKFYDTIDVEVVSRMVRVFVTEGIIFPSVINKDQL